MIIDTNHDTTGRAPQLRAAMVTGVIRYFNRLSPNGEKQVKAAEARYLADNDLQLGIVYEGQGDRLSAFSEDTGYADAVYSRALMPKIGMPSGAGLYFAADADFTRRQDLTNVIPYFRGVGRAFAEDNGLPVARIGVYGSGLSCETVGGAGLAELFWTSCSTGWEDTRTFNASNKWHLRQHLPKTIAGLDTDPDDANPLLPDWGGFTPFAVASPPAGLRGVAMMVTARSGLNLRGAPSAGGSILRLLPYGSRVTIEETSTPGWPHVDADGDGRPDGYVSATYLAVA